MKGGASIFSDLGELIVTILELLGEILGDVVANRPLSTVKVSRMLAIFKYLGIIGS